MKKILKKFLLGYLKTLTRIKLKYNFQGKIIVIGGCYGKSSAVNLITSILSEKYKVISTYKGGKGLNSETGIPFAILGVKADRYSLSDWIKYSISGFLGLFKKIECDYFVMEFGVDKPGDGEFFYNMIKPEIGVLLNSDISHSVYFEDLHNKTRKSYKELIAKENGFIYEASKDSIFYRSDDNEIISQTKRFKGDNLYDYLDEGSYKIISFKPTVNGTTLKYKFLKKTYSVTFKYPLLEDFKDTVKAALALSDHLSIKPSKINKAIENFTLPPGRSTLFSGVKDTYILDSSYNSQFTSVSQMLELTKKISPKRCIAVLGDMRELGALSGEKHLELGKIASNYADIVITVGPLMKQYFRPNFLRNSKENQKIFSFISTKKALNLIKKNNYELLQPKDTILVKGSQNTLLLEIIVEKLLADESKRKMLCRRGELYNKERLKLLR